MILKSRQKRDGRYFLRKEEIGLIYENYFSGTLLSEFICWIKNS